MKENKDELKEQMKSIVEKAFDFTQTLGEQYVVEYRLKEDDSLLGYHASTFCQLTDDWALAKRYSGTNPYKQIGTIQENLNGILSKDRTTFGPFGVLVETVKKQFFPDMNPEDIYLRPMYLDISVEPHKLKMTEI